MKKQLLATAFAALVAGATLAASTPTIVSSQVRANDPTVLDVVYKVTSDQPTVKVRALAFEDGTRSFYNVVRPETFVNDPDGNPSDSYYYCGFRLSRALANEELRGSVCERA